MILDPERFLAAQRQVWARVKAELAAGRKESHWMWFIFPQLGALGRSATAKHFGLDDLQAARSYLAHPVLGRRLAEAARLMLRHRGQPPEAVLGGTDAIKLRSSMTLFSRVPGADPVFAEVLAAFHGGEECPGTLAIIDPNSP